jgi:hypothetical protein
MLHDCADLNLDEHLLSPHHNVHRAIPVTWLFSSIDDRYIFQCRSDGLSDAVLFIQVGDQQAAASDVLN